MASQVAEKQIELIVERTQNSMLIHCILHDNREKTNELTEFWSLSHNIHTILMIKGIIPTLYSEIGLEIVERSYKSCIFSICLLSIRWLKIYAR